MNVGPGAVWSSILALRRQLEFRRQIKLTVEHKRDLAMRTSSAFVGTHTHLKDVYIVTVTNKSPKRDLVVKRVWFATTPEVEIPSPELPVRIKPEDSWSREVRTHTVPGTPAEVQRLARCQLAVDDKIIKSRPT